MENRYKRTKIACYTGYFVQAIINNFLPLLFVMLNKNYQVSYEMLGRLILLNFFTQLCVDLLSFRIVKTFGYKRSVFAADVLAALGLILLSVLPLMTKHTYIAICISVVIYATGSGLIEVLISPIIEYLPTDNKSSGMSLLHSFYCWGQVATVAVTTLFFTVFGIDEWYIMGLIWAVVPIINIFMFIGAPIVQPEGDSASENPQNSILKNKSFYVYLILMFCAGSCELAVSQWASAFAEQGLHISKSAGDLLGPCSFAVFMGIGRVLYGIVGDKININKVLTFASVLCLCCYVTLSFSNNAVLSLAACSLCGFSVSVMWPGTYSLAAKNFRQGGTAMFGLLAALGDIGCAMGPWITGLVSTDGDLSKGFTVGIIFPLTMVILLVVTNNARRRRV